MIRIYVAVCVVVFLVRAGGMIYKGRNDVSLVPSVLPGLIALGLGIAGILFLGCPK